MAISEKTHDSWDENERPGDRDGHVQDGESIDVHLVEKGIPGGKASHVCTAVSREW
jgi:hypothetical protein